MCWFNNKIKDSELHEPLIRKPLIFNNKSDNKRILEGEFDIPSPPIELRPIRQYPKSILDNFNTLSLLLCLLYSRSPLILLTC